MHHERKVSRSMLERKRLDFSLELKAIEENGRFAGYASVFDVVDRQKDIILRGAFQDTLAGRAGQIKLLWQHQFEEPIGVFDRIVEDEHGLYVEGRLLLDIQRAREAYSLLRAGAIEGLSIGYSPVRYSIDPETGVRLIARVELWEISLVTFPANAQAGVTQVKDMIVPPRDGTQLKADSASWPHDAAWLQLQRSGELLPLMEALERARSSLGV